MIAQLLVPLVLALAPNLQAEPADPLALEPADLPVAEAGRWDGLFLGRDVNMDKLPESLIPMMDRCRMAYVRRDFPEAVSSYFELLNTEPDFPPALLELGTVYFRLRRYGDTVACLERFLSVAPEQVWRTQVLAHSYYSLGRYEEALASYEVVLEGLPDSVEAVRGLALTHYRLGDSEQALLVLGRVLELDPKHAEALMWQAQILFEEERMDEALGAAKRARDLNRFHPRPWYLLWQIYLDLGQSKDAEAAHREWKRVDALAQQVRSLEGQLLYRPDDYALAMRLAVLQEELGDREGVRKAFAHAVRSRPEEVTELSLRLHILDVLFELNDTEGAAEAAEALARHCGQEAEAWKRLEVYYARIGNPAAQVKAGELYLRLSREQ